MNNRQLWLLLMMLDAIRQEIRSLALAGQMDPADIALHSRAEELAQNALQIAGQDAGEYKET